MEWTKSSAHLIELFDRLSRRRKDREHDR